MPTHRADARKVYDLTEENTTQAGCADNRGGNDWVLGAESFDRYQGC